MPDARVQAAIENWGPRLIANGIDLNDFVRTTASISRWEEWLEAWSATAGMHRELGEQARQAGHERSAGEAFLRAAVSYHFAKFVWVLDPERNRRATEAAIRSLYDAHAVLDPTAERIEAPLEHGSIVANLRRPAGPGPAAAGDPDSRAGLDQGGVLRVGVGVPGKGDGHAFAGRSGPG